MAAVWYVVIGLVLVGVLLLVWGVVPLVRRVRPLVGAVTEVRRHRGAVRLLAERAARLNGEFVTVRDQLADTQGRAVAVIPDR